MTRTRRFFSATLACIVGVTLSPLPAVADPQASTPQAPAASQAPAARSRSSAGDLVAPDPVSAGALARLTGERVEIVGQRTAYSSSYALSDGSFVQGQAAGPIWIRGGGDGTHDTDWQAVDVDLVAGADGVVRPKAHPGGLVFSGGGSKPDGRVASVHGVGTGDGVWLAWPGSLPKPSLDGPRATYPDVAPGVDLVFEATRTGFQQYFIVKTRPAAGKAPRVTLSFGTEGAASLVSTTDGGALVNGADGRTLASIGAPLAWDAAVDSERTHPVTQRWESESTLPGVARSIGRAPQITPAATSNGPTPGASIDTVDRTPVAPKASAEDRTTAKGKPGRASDAEAKAAHVSPPVTLPRALVGGVTKNVARFDLTLDDALLQDPDTVFPVVIDPSTSFAWGFDTWVQKSWTSDQSGSTELKLGTYNGGADIARSFVHFNVSSLIGKHITGRASAKSGHDSARSLIGRRLSRA